MLESLFNKVVALGLQLFKKETSTEVSPCKYFEVSKNTYFEEHLRTAASDVTSDELTLLCRIERRGLIFTGKQQFLQSNG